MDCLKQNGRKTKVANKIMMGGKKMRHWEASKAREVTDTKGAHGNWGTLPFLPKQNNALLRTNIMLTYS